MLGVVVAIVHSLSSPLGTVAPAAADPVWKLEDGLVVSGVARGGRIPIPRDGLLGTILTGKFQTPSVGGKVVGADGREHIWSAMHSEKDGFLRGDALDNAYVYAVYQSPVEQDLILTATSDTLVYVNGTPHAGDPYGYGYLSLPVHLKAGANEFLFSCGRGQLAARLERVKSMVQFGGGDWTVPDILPSDDGNFLGAVPVINNSGEPVSGMRLRVSVDGRTVETPFQTILPQSVRKESFVLPLPKDRAPGNKEYSVAIVDGRGQVLDSTSVSLRVLAPLQPYKRTFASKIDGSVQYYAVTPSQKPDPSDALVLTLHGASVEALGQAQAYGSKDWCTIVAATNRRPYGFDWEKWGRRDALEVLDLAKAAFPHDPARVSLTGHSMGGHGTWSIGSLYPDTFASVNPSAGWISFASYAGGYVPTNPTPIDQTFLTANVAGDTLARKVNLLQQRVFILHGDKDDNVPVTEARTMKKELEAIGATVGYHEEPGAGHWWGGRCVDYPDLFENIKQAKLLASDDPSPIRFVTPNPAISSHDRYVTVRQSITAGISQVDFKLSGDTLTGTTSNVGAMELGPIRASFRKLMLDGQEILWNGASSLKLKRVGLTWTEPKAWDAGEKSPARSGPFEEAFTRKMVWVYGTRSNSAELNLALVRFLSEAWLYRGNGSFDVISDTEYAAGKAYSGRNVVLIGNADTNSAWKTCLGSCPIVADQHSIKLGSNVFDATGKAALFLYPKAKDSQGLVAAIAISDRSGMEAVARLPLFTSGSDFPDWTVLDATRANEGTAGVLSAGFFDNQWRQGQL